MENDMQLFSPALLDQARKLVNTCRDKGASITTAESCTGGLVSGIITEIAGSSDVFKRGFVTYSDEAKTDLVGVSPSLIENHGAVSEEVARAMAEGVLVTASATLAIGITGIAGPGGERPNKPVGTVHLACAGKAAETLHEHHVFKGDRTAVRLQAVEAALAMLIKQAEVI